MSSTKSKIKDKARKAGEVAKKTANSVVDTAKNNPKTLLAVGGLIIGGFIVYKVYKKIFPPEPSLDDLGQDPNTPPTSLTDLEAKNIAERLYNAMLVITGTDEEEIFDALQGLTANDFLKVYKAFGLRQYSLFWGNQGDPLFSDKHDLLVWLGNELTTSEMNQLRHLIPGI